MSLPYKELPDTALDALIVRERTRVVAPLTDWRALSAQLRDEGVIRMTSGSAASEQPFRSVPPARPRSGVQRWGMRLLAGSILVGSGVLVGRSINLGSEIVTTVRDAMIADSMTVHLSNGTGNFTSTAEAKHALTNAEAKAHQAAAYLTAHDSVFPVLSSPDQYRERLQMLDQMLDATQQAVQASPADPVLNQYYLSAFGARQRTVRQLNAVLKPVGARLTGY